MSIMENDYFFSRQFREETPAWYRLERYEYCEGMTGSALYAKRRLFARLAGKKRSK